MNKICRYCGKEIGMDDYRAYTIVQHEDETAITVYLHSSCIDMDSDHWMIRILESHSELKNTQYDTKEDRIRCLE